MSAQLEAVAHHEAGHVAVGCALRVPILWVELSPHVTRHQPFAGTTMPGDINIIGGSLRSLRNQLERWVKVLLAGECAQRRYDARSVRRWHGHDDRAAARTIVRALGFARLAASAYLAQLEVEADRLVEREWLAVERIAKALLEHGRIEGDELKRIYYRK